MSSTVFHDPSFFLNGAKAVAHVPVRGIPVTCLDHYNHIDMKIKNALAGAQVDSFGKITRTKSMGMAIRRFLYNKRSFEEFQALLPDPKDLPEPERDLIKMELKIKDVTFEETAKI